MCLLGGFRFQLLVVLRFLYAELFIEEIVIDGQVEVPFQVERTVISVFVSVSFCSGKQNFPPEVSMPITWKMSVMS